jgi:O-antigen ligase
LISEQSYTLSLTGRSFAYVFPFSIISAIIASALTGHITWMACPFILLFIAISVHKIHWIYFLLLATIPFSTEVEIGGGLSTDFPDEILMWWLCLIGGLYFLSNKKNVIKLLHHPVTWMLIFHWIWILICSIGSQDMLVSIKFWLSKSWYLFIFYVLAYFFLQSEKRLITFSWVSAIGASITVLLVEGRHGMTGFAFNTINSVVQPFYRNHVNYACLQVCILPYLYPLWKYYKHKPYTRYLIVLLALIMLSGIGLSYTRAAYIALFSLIVIYPILKWKLIDTIAIMLLVSLSLGLVYLNYHNNFLDLAPDYTKAITHTDFSSLLAATPEGRDVSTMERLYRWVAGSRMIGEKYFLGFGPGGFYNYYQSYTLTQFTTYVSANPDRSSTHNYFLMTAVEQGIPGLLIFLGIIVLYFRQAQYSLFTIGAKYFSWALASVWSLSSILVILFFNDMIETDKVGSYFFINLAILVCTIDLNKADRTLN